jgi:hypothetical protein
MRIELKVTGVKQAQEMLRRKADILEGKQGRFYQNQLTIIKKAIVVNADPSYQNSPAKLEALESVNQPWSHQGSIHQKDIMAPLFANYRQYGCGGLEIHELVRFTPADMQEMLLAAVHDLE